MATGSDLLRKTGCAATHHYHPGLEGPVHRRLHVRDAWSITSCARWRPPAVVRLTHREELQCRSASFVSRWGKPQRSLVSFIPSSESSSCHSLSWPPSSVPPTQTHQQFAWPSSCPFSTACWGWLSRRLRVLSTTWSRAGSEVLKWN